jgi:hypothetical protein
MIAPYFSVRRTEPNTIASFAQQLLQHNPNCLSENGCLKSVPVETTNVEKSHRVNCQCSIEGILALARSRRIRCSWRVCQSNILTKALTIHFQDMHMMIEPVDQRANQAFCAKSLGSFLEGQIAAINMGLCS